MSSYRCGQCFYLYTCCQFFGWSSWHFLVPFFRKVTLLVNPTAFQVESTSEILEEAVAKSIDGGLNCWVPWEVRLGPLPYMGEYTYVGCGRTLTVVDVSDPTAMVCVQRIPRPRPSPRSRQRKALSSLAMRVGRSVSMTLPSQPNLFVFA